MDKIRKLEDRLKDYETFLKKQITHEDNMAGCDAVLGTNSAEMRKVAYANALGNLYTVFPDIFPEKNHYQKNAKPQL